MNEELKQKKSIKVNKESYISEPKYNLEDVILSESVKKAIERIVSYFKYHNKIFEE